jgi:hypothetical protein
MAAIILHRQRRHSHIHGAGGFGDHAQGLGVVGDAGEAQIVEGKIG